MNDSKCELPSRSAYSIAQLLEIFRSATKSQDMLDVLFRFATRLINAQNRQRFYTEDGPTTLAKHLARLCEEQAIFEHQWTTSEVFGFPWEISELRNCLLLTHAFGVTQLIESNAIEELMQLYKDLPEGEMNIFKEYILEIFRNICFHSRMKTRIVRTLCMEMWILLDTDLNSNYGKNVSMKILAADVLSNLTFHDSTATSATEINIGVVCSILLDNQTPLLLRLAIVDLLKNLSNHTTYMLYIFSELDRLKPKNYNNCSVAYLLELSELIADLVLKRSLEILIQNLTQIGILSKRKVQKLCLSKEVEKWGPSCMSRKI